MIRRFLQLKTLILVKINFDFLRTHEKTCNLIFRDVYKKKYIECIKDSIVLYIFK